LWIALKSWLRSACRAEGLKWEDEESAFKVSAADGNRFLRMEFRTDGIDHRLDYALEDGTSREAAVFVTTEGHAVFHKDTAGQNPEHFGKKLLRELREDRS
jgi:hypothetical protein